MKKKKLIEQIEFLEKELQKSEYREGYLNEKLQTSEFRIKNLLEQLNDVPKYKPTTITRIIHNDTATIVWFGEETKIIVKKAKDEEDSVYSAVAYAIAKLIFRTNTNFKRKVDELLNEK